MRSLAQNIAIYTVSLYVLSFLLDGVQVSGGFLNYLLGGIILYILFVLIRPLLRLISLPLNLITLGAFSFVINAVILYLLTVFFSSVTIKAFLYKGVSFAGFAVPKFYVNTFFAFILASLFLSVIISGLKWIIKK